MAAEGASTNSSYMERESQQHPGVSSITDEFSSRPEFVDQKRLLRQYACALCKKILVQPRQTPCGNRVGKPYRVCKPCIDKEFAGKPVIKCPLPHDDMDEEELRDELCQQGGLRREEVLQDHGSMRALQRERCYCMNREFGCPDTPQWKQLKDHQATCPFVPLTCSNHGCPARFSAKGMPRHKEECQYAPTSCHFCKQTFRRKDLEAHHDECEYADTQCTGCDRKFERRRQLIVHQRIHAPCIMSAGRCYFYDYCRFETSSVPDLRNHLENDKDLHLQAVIAGLSSLYQKAMKTKELDAAIVKKNVAMKVKPLERVTAEMVMNVKKIKEKIESSETNADHLVNAMRTVANSKQQIEQVQTKVRDIERQIKESGLDRVSVIESHAQNIRRHDELLNDMEKRMRNAENTSHDGNLIWKISDYKRKKGDAIRGRQMSIYSHPFFTSRFGYKMCCRAYLNGDGLGRGKCLSLFFVLMRGEYDELLEFPFKQRVTFTLLSPKSPSLSKHETFRPDPDSSSFRRPQTEMNVASGCPQFALHSEVESSTFLVSDCIYIRVRVEPRGDVIP